MATDYTQPLITGQTEFAFEQILEAIQPWLLADPQYSALYQSMGATLDNLLSENLTQMKNLRDASVQNELLLRLLAEFLGFEWSGSSVLSEEIIQKICQTIPSYYARNGCGSSLIHGPIHQDLLMQNAQDLILLQDYSPILLETVNTDFYNPDVFRNVQTTARLVSFAIQSNVIVQQLWTKDYVNFYTLEEVQALFGGKFGYYDTIYSTLNRAGVFYQGLWDASTNSPLLQDGTGSNGLIYSCAVAGTVDFGSGPIVFEVGDTVEYQYGKWFKANNGVWYLSPHISLEVLNANTNIKYRELISLFYYLAPVTMVIGVIKQRFEGTTKLYYTLQPSTYHITYESIPLVTANLSGTATQYYTTLPAHYRSRYVANIHN